MTSEIPMELLLRDVVVGCDGDPHRITVAN
jgi:hypothetical protein